MSSGGAGRAILAHRGFGNCKLSLGGEHLGQCVPISCPAPQIAVISGAAVYGGSGVSEPPLNCEAPRGTVRGDPGSRYAGGFESRFSMILMVAAFICEDGKCCWCSWHSCSVLAKEKVGLWEWTGGSQPKLNTIAQGLA